MLSIKIRNKIQKYKKNKLDISDLIKEHDISGEDLSCTIIKKINRFNENLKNINFSGCIIGEEGITNNLAGCDLRGSNFKNTVIKGKMVLRRSDCRKCNFSESFMPFVEYQYCDFRGSNLCDAVIRVGSRGGHGAIVDDTFLLSWGLVIEEGNQKINNNIKKVMEGLGWMKKH